MFLSFFSVFVFKIVITEIKHCVVSVLYQFYFSFISM